MLTEKQIEQVIDAMKPFHPKKIAYSGYDSYDDYIELLYDFNDRATITESTKIMMHLKEKFGIEVNLVEYDCIPDYCKDRVLKEAIVLYHDQRAKREPAQAM
ncbi:MAG: hypothetical protein OXE77_02645 [Flavobacteriaceae bacterium]|nr:hypothetical protein [Flavobacteriaceae bacterium]MCY4299890.1 hypothetical protein [Flavobacteriaceae bacterium]